MRSLKITEEAARSMRSSAESPILDNRPAGPYTVFIDVEDSVATKLEQARRAGESWSDVIIRLNPRPPH